MALDLLGLLQLLQLVPAALAVQLQVHAAPDAQRAPRQVGQLALPDVLDALLIVRRVLESRSPTSSACQQTPPPTFTPLFTWCGLDDTLASDVVLSTVMTGAHIMTSGGEAGEARS